MEFLRKRFTRNKQKGLPPSRQPIVVITRGGGGSGAGAATRGRCAHGGATANSNMWHGRGWPGYYQHAAGAATTPSYPTWSHPSGLWTYGSVDVRRGQTPNNNTRVVPFEERQAMHLAEQQAIWESLQQQKNTWESFNPDDDPSNHNDLFSGHSSRPNDDGSNQQSDNYEVNDHSNIVDDHSNLVDGHSNLVDDHSENLNAADKVKNEKLKKIEHVNDNSPGLVVIRNETQDQRMLRLTLEQERRRADELSARLKWVEEALKRKENTTTTTSG